MNKIYSCTHYSDYRWKFPIAESLFPYYRLESKLSKHAKFLHRVRVTHKDSVPPMLITGHQLSMGCQYQAAAREYLEAYKLQPENPLVNLCVGM